MTMLTKHVVSDIQSMINETKEAKQTLICQLALGEWNPSHGGRYHSCPPVVTAEVYFCKKLQRPELTHLGCSF